MPDRHNCLTGFGIDRDMNGITELLIGLLFGFNFSSCRSFGRLPGGPARGVQCMCNETSAYSRRNRDPGLKYTGFHGPTIAEADGNGL